jgi:hypothetical protein
MNREVHVRIWERPEVRVLRATRHFRLCRLVSGAAGQPQYADPTPRTGAASWRSVTDRPDDNC